MQKKVLALAVAGLVSGAAFAQSNVTIYGVADAGFVHANGNGVAAQNNAWNGIQSGNLAGSRIGFKGEEGLGNGLKAVFTLEYNLNIDNNSGIGSNATTPVAGTLPTGAGFAAGGSYTGTATNGLQARQQFIGLSHAKLGTLSLGRQYAPGFATQARNDAFVGSAAAGALNYLNTAAGNSIQAGSNARWDNSVAYTSPNWSGFTVSAIYGYGEQGSATVSNPSGAQGNFGAGLNYANGPLNLDVVYQSRLNQNTFGLSAVGVVTRGNAKAATGADNVNEWLIGGSYDFGVAKVFATYQDQNDNVNTSADDTGNKVWHVGVSVPVFGNGKVIANYGHLSWDRTGAGSNTAYAIGYLHSLSKRTTLYTAYTSLKNDDDAVTRAGAGAVSAFGERNNVFTAGINHTF